MALVANFTGANDTNLLTSYTSDSGDTFKQIYCAEGSPKIYNNRFYTPPTTWSGNETWICSNTNSASADSTVEGVLYFLSGSANAAGISVRTSGASSTSNSATFYGYSAIHSNGLWKLYYHNNNGGLGLGGTQIGSSAAQTLNTGTPYKVKLSAIGTTITLSTDAGDGNYVQRIQVTDSTISAAGAAGLYLANDTTSGGGSSSTGYQWDSVSEVATAITLTGPSSGAVGVASTNFTVGANGGITGTITVTPSDGGGGGTFTPTSVNISSGSQTATFTYTPASSGAKTISVTNNGSLSNPSNITYTANAAATAVTMSGPSSGTINVASTNFTIGANGSITGTVIVTPSDGGAGGSFSPTTASISNGTPTATFTYTPTTLGARTISVTNNGSLSNPSNITYTSNAASATSVTLTGPTSGLVSAASSNFTVGANGAITGTVVVTPSATGGGSFSPTTVSINSGTPTGTFTYTPTSTGAKTISVTNNGGLSNPSNITYTVSTNASAVTMTGPSAGVVGGASSNFTIAANGIITGTVVVTPSDSAGGGTFTPTSVSINSTTPSATFTYTAASVGTKTISVTNDGGLSNPSNISYTASLAVATIALIGPAAGYVSAASDNYTATISGTFAGSVIVTPSDSAGGGTFTPTTVTLTTGARSASFTYTPASIGSKTISITNNGGHTNPSPLSYLVASSNSLLGPTAPSVGTTTTSITVACGAGATGGSGGYTYQWYKDTFPDFSAGVHNQIASSNTLSITDSTGLLPDTYYYYKCRVMDGTNAVRYSKIIGGTLKSPSIGVCFVGDSITYGSGATSGKDAPTQCCAILTKTYKHRVVSFSNLGVVGTTTTDWSQTVNINSIISNCTTNSLTYVHLMLGANDATQGISAATYLTNLQTLTAGLISAGLKVILSYPAYVPDNPGASSSNPARAGRLYSYLAVIDSLINHTTILRGDTLSHAYFMATYATEYVDELHPNDTGALSLGTMWARAIDRALFPVNKPIPTKTVTVTFKSRIGSPQSNLSGLKWTWSDAQGYIMDVGTGAVTDANGVFTITVHTGLPTGGIGYLEVNNAAGVINTSFLSFSGPAVVS